ncbi:hypothetical protein HQ531_09705 [bacterium]|nr:hypothetical protein [bacterium]
MQYREFAFLTESLRAFSRRANSSAVAAGGMQADITIVNNMMPMTSIEADLDFTS